MTREVAYYVHVAVYPLGYRISWSCRFAPVIEHLKKSWTTIDSIIFLVVLKHIVPSSSHFGPLLSFGEATSREKQAMATRTIFEKLSDRDSILDVPTDQVAILRPHDRQSAIGTQISNGNACLVLMGTSPQSSIIIAHFDYFGAGIHTCGRGSESARRIDLASEVEAYHMCLLWRVVKTFLEKNEYFQLPLAWGVFGYHESQGLLDIIRERTLKVFQHLRVNVGFSTYQQPLLESAQPVLGQHTVFAVRHGAEVPEIYIGDCLVLRTVVQDLTIVLLGADARFQR
jgi:hypothetical protein